MWGQLSVRLIVVACAVAMSLAAGRDPARVSVSEGAPSRFGGPAMLDKVAVDVVDNDLARAREDARQAIRQAPHDWYPYHLLASIELRRGDVRAAEAAYQSFLRRPDNRATERLATIVAYWDLVSRDRRRVADAEAGLREALHDIDGKLASGDAASYRAIRAHALVVLGDVCLLRNNLVEAEACFRKVVEGGGAAAPTRLPAVEPQRDLHDAQERLNWLHR